MDGDDGDELDEVDKYDHGHEDGNDGDSGDYHVLAQSELISSGPSGRMRGVTLGNGNHGTIHGYGSGYGYGDDGLLGLVRAYTM